MKFSTQEDIDVPIDNVFDILTRFEIYERAAIRRGAEVRRRGAGTGAAWNVRFVVRGKELDLVLDVARCDAPTDLVINISSGNLTGTAVCKLFALSRSRTRMTISAEIRPLTLSARLMIQPLRLARVRVMQKYKDRVAELAREIEARYRSES